MSAYQHGPHHRSPTPAPDIVARETRRLILDTAARLFRQEGYAATSLRDIAAECGMRAGSLYHHFDSKDEIVGEVLRIGVERVADEVRGAVAALPTDADVRTLLRTAIAAHLAALHELHDYTSANVRIFGQVPAAVRRDQIATRDAYEQFWSSLLARCARDARWSRRRDLRLTRLFVIDALNGSLEWFTDGRASTAQIAAQFTDLLLDGLMPRASAIGPDAGPAPRKRARSPVRRTLSR